MKLINGDCLDYLKQIPDKSIDMILQDPPYNTTDCKWEWDIMTKIDEFWKEWNRVIKPNGAIVMFGSEPFSSKLRLSNIKNYKYDWIWEKTRGTGFQIIKYKPLNFYENISVFCNGTTHINHCELKKLDKPVKSGRKSKTGEGKILNAGCNNIDYVSYFTNYSRNIIKIASEHNVGKYKFHPTQKPVALIEFLIKTYTNEGETVFDGFMGSGTCGVACKNLNRDFIGVELDEKYFEIAKNRIEVK